MNGHEETIFKMDEEACLKMNEDEHELTLSVQSFSVNEDKERCLKMKQSFWRMEKRKEVK
jgi:hypothetical protein